MMTAARALFASLVRQPDEAIDLAVAALAIAQEEYPHLEMAPYIGRLDGLARVIADRMPDRPSPHTALAAINRHLFDDEGFRGNVDEYDDPRNSFLNDVLDRKRGLPITLSVVYIEVSRRLGLPVVGVSFPGHFLVKYVGPDDEIILDPFHGGAVLNLDDCQETLDRMYGGRVPLKMSFLGPATPKQIVHRMLLNLKGCYARRDQWDKALSVIDRILLVAPDAIDEHRDRGFLYLRLECFQAALTDLETYLARSPDAEDAGQIRGQVIALREQVARLH